MRRGSAKHWFQLNGAFISNIVTIIIAFDNCHCGDLNIYRLLKHQKLKVNEQFKGTSGLFYHKN